MELQSEEDRLRENNYWFKQALEDIVNPGVDMGIGDYVNIAKNALNKEKK